MRRLRSIARSILARLGLLKRVRKLLKRPLPHGHGLLLRLLPEVARSASAGSVGAVVIEIGSTRENLPGQGSTRRIAELAQDLRVPFITVDMDPANTERARSHLARLRNAEAVTAKGEEFLATFDRPVLAAYLDAFDIAHDQHSAYRRGRYRQFLSAEITNEAASAMHLACAQALDRIVVPGGLIVIDDTWPDSEGTEWTGKGSTAVPWLQSAGFEIVGRSRSAVALQRRNAD